MTHGGLRKNAGRKPKFFDLTHIKNRENVKRHYKRTKISDEDLEQKLIEKFKKENWK